MVVVLCIAPITYERAEELDLPLMVANNTAVHATPFTVSIDLLTHGCTTGISAYDRAQTILALTREETKPEDFGRPGHIFPLRTFKGVLRRAGYTEAAIDFARLDSYPKVHWIGIKKEDGSMARLPELIEMAKNLIENCIGCRSYKIPVRKRIAYRARRRGKTSNRIWRFSFDTFPSNIYRRGARSSY